MHDAERDRQKLIDAHLEDLIARIGLEDLQQVFAAVAHGRESAGLEDCLYLATQHRNTRHALAVRRGRKEPEDAALARDVSIVVESLDTDVVQIGGPMNG